jgi:transmembrane sensor
MTRDIDSTMSVPEQASHWWELLHSGSASTTDHQEFGEWVARSPERVEAYLETARLIRALKSRQLRWPLTSAEVLIREAKASPQDALPFSPGHSAHPQESRLGGRDYRTYFALGFAAALLVGIGSAWFVLERPRQFKTEIGEQRSVLLEDGSRVTLNTASKIEVDLRKGRRMVRLVEGEAYFDLTHDAMRPFKVRVGNAVLSDVGTVFNVDMRPTRTTVTVVEGRVAVDSAAQGPLVLAASDCIVITASGPGTPQRGINVTAAIAWTQRELIFEHRPLSDVAGEFNRYNRDRIEIDGVELQRQEVTGVFQAKDPASFISFLSTIPGVEIRQGRDGTHIVTSRDKTANREAQGAR